MRYSSFATIVILLLLMPSSPAAEKYEANWASIDSRPTPQWFTDAKFGIFIHWGVYAVPSWAPTKGVGTYGGYSEWYWKGINGEREGAKQFIEFHRKTFGHKTRYQDFAPRFKAEMFDPDDWADVIASSGAKYVVLTSKHHDGFCLWPSAQSWNWNSVDVGPHRDLAGDLTKAIRKRDVRMGFYYSLYEWYNPTWKSDPRRYVDQHMIPQIKDLVTRYEPDVLWADGEWDQPSDFWRSTEILQWLYNESACKEHIAVNDRWGKETRGKHGGYYTTEYDLVHSDIVEGYTQPWEECRGIGHSFGYNRNEKLADYSTTRELIHKLVVVVSRGGNLLLDIGPTADGRIPVIMEERLRHMGRWLDVNGEAIYKSRRFSGKGSEKVVFTTKDNAVYAICLAWPGKQLALKVTPKPHTTVTLLGRKGTLPWELDEGVMKIDVSEITIDQMPCDHAYVFKLDGTVRP